jgi:hypothetical protein
MSREYKNILRRPRVYGEERRKNLTKEILQDSTPIPSPLEYEDVDEAFCNWVKDDLKISFEGSDLPTIVLFANQRFTEYMQSWKDVDDKRNFIPNFKAVTRENNPKPGTIVGQTRNIPGERTYLMKRVEALDKANRKYYIDYRVKQPFSVDLIYSVSIVSTKYQLLNDFNLLIQNKFKAIDCYIRPKGHFIPMKLNDVSDESEYSIDNRQYYSQTYNITVMAYIMPKDSFSVEERPILKLVGFENTRKKSNYADIIDIPCKIKADAPYSYTKTVITVHLDECSFGYKFNIDCDFNFKKLELTNVRGFKLYINDKEEEVNENLKIKTNDEIKIKSVGKYRLDSESEIKFIGYSPTDTYEKNGDEKIIEIDAE